MRCTGSCPGRGNPLPRQGTGLREAVFCRFLFVGCKDTLQRPLTLGFGCILGPLFDASETSKCGSGLQCATVGLWGTFS